MSPYIRRYINHTPPIPCITLMTVTDCWLVKLPYDKTIFKTLTPRGGLERQQQRHHVVVGAGNIECWKDKKSILILQKRNKGHALRFYFRVKRKYASLGDFGLLSKCWYEVSVYFFHGSLRCHSFNARW